MFYGGSGLQLGIQVLGAVIISVWSAGWSCALFYGLRHFKLLRVRLADEMIGEPQGRCNMQVLKVAEAMWYSCSPCNVHCVIFIV